MSHTLKLTQEDPVIHIKAYAGVQINGIDQTEVQCDIDSSQLATMIEEDGHVYITANASCVLKVPVGSSVIVEKGMGSVKITDIRNKISVEKVLGNLVFLNVGMVDVAKVGGNFSVRKAKDYVRVEKVAGNLTVEDVVSFQCEKVGGNCRIKSVAKSLILEKVGGKFSGLSIGSLDGDTNIGGSFIGRELLLNGDVNVGGRIKLAKFELAEDQSIRAGGDIELALNGGQRNMLFKIRSGGEKIRIKVGDDRIEYSGGTYDYQLGQGGKTVTLAAGGHISLTDQIDFNEEVIGDLSDNFKFEESAYSEMIQDRIKSATKMAEAKVKSAEIRLEQIREKLEKQRGIDLDFGFGDSEKQVRRPEAPVPPVQRFGSKKGATDEERLMILKMLQDKKISVEEAETLFRALEE